MRRLRGYGRPWYWWLDSAAQLLEVLAEPRPLFAGGEVARDRIAVMPMLYHLLWRQELVRRGAAGAGAGQHRGLDATRGEPW
ncbi:hypothetical protein GCM10010245_38190 [Streptomyces spectabilis]|nr:hypothetical protein GCM10010245_38190 [Streptomyces spectabilis]